MKDFTLIIISPDSTIFEGECSSLIFEAPDGKYGIQANHAPLISAVSKGTLSITSSGKEESLTVPGGVLKFENNECIIITQISG